MAPVSPSLVRPLMIGVQALAEAVVDLSSIEASVPSKGAMCYTSCRLPPTAKGGRRYPERRPLDDLRNYKGFHLTRGMANPQGLAAIAMMIKHAPVSLIRCSTSETMTTWGSHPPRPRFLPKSGLGRNPLAALVSRRKSSISSRAAPIPAPLSIVDCFQWTRLCLSSFLDRQGGLDIVIRKEVYSTRIIAFVDQASPYGCTIVLSPPVHVYRLSENISRENLAKSRSAYFTLRLDV
ncbi:hypothetical protein BD324DRAFT_34359 [Kockovaella imperatae]|uniref:Uncharacterized protein n=1 Tax=Kockovaella imperatae TaxID=4999 RepID=A0A1Y1USP1_9TREE|nr:hypothetical protein BD324DRAFT_34359 [Kockovaella imperatae]ORX41029.1 hypothetical protein BD324DRAFT_34359 [Kockovaella imperatae]